MELVRRDVPLDEIAAFPGHTPRLRITAMYAKRGPEYPQRALAAIDRYLKELRGLVDARPVDIEAAPDPVCGRIAVTRREGEVAKPPGRLVELIGIEPT